MLDLELVSVIAYIIGASAGLGLVIQLYRAYKQYRADAVFGIPDNSSEFIWDKPIRNLEFAQDFPKVTKRINAKVKKAKAKKAKKASKVAKKTKKTTRKSKT